jgi:hypothetical protein
LAATFRAGQGASTAEGACTRPGRKIIGVNSHNDRIVLWKLGGIHVFKKGNTLTKTCDRLELCNHPLGQAWCRAACSHAHLISSWSNSLCERWSAKNNKRETEKEVTSKNFYKEVEARIKKKQEGTL